MLEGRRSMDFIQVILILLGSIILYPFVRWIYSEDKDD